MTDFDVGNIQFLDLTGVEEKEQQWILTSLKTRDSTVKGPWLQSNYPKPKIYQSCNMITDNVTSQMNLNNCYPSASNLILPPPVFPQAYQSPVPVFQTGFIPPVQYQTPIVATIPQISGMVNTMVPVNGSIVPVNSSVIPVNASMLPVNSTLIPVNTTIIPLNPPLLANHYPSQHVPYTPYPSNPQYHPVEQTDIEINSDIVVPIETYEEEIIETKREEPEEEEIKESKLLEENMVKTETKSWASLFNKKTTNECGKNDDSSKPLAKVSPFIQNSLKSSGNENTTHSKRRDSFEDPNYYRMGEILRSYTIDHKITSLQPRGLINRSNYCYINSILQAVIACPLFYNLIMTLSENSTPKDNRKHTQIIDNVIKFVNEFHLLPPGQRVNRRSDTKKKELTVSVNCDRPFEPYWIYKMLNGIRSDSFVVEGRQEDAEEFLGCLLNGLNDEMLELIKLVKEEEKPIEKSDDSGPDGDKEWQLIGPKNKGCVTRRTEMISTPISDLFGGHFRSRLHRTGDQITDNIQPFFTLQLNIEKVNTVKEALEALVCKNQIEGVTSSKTNEEVEAWQQVSIEELPVVLILHLKCFDFKLDGCTKIIKQLEFPIDLKIDTKLLSSKNNYQSKEKQYKLFAVVYHDGKEASKGHYITDAYHIGYSSWLRYDDAAVKTVQEEHVLKPHGNRVPYLLFYRRCDTVRSK